MRKLLVVVGAGSLLALAVVACDSFSAKNGDAPADASAESAASGLDATSVSDTGTDAAPVTCSQLDAASHVQPTANLGAYDCGDGQPRNLVGDPRNCGWCGHVCLDTVGCTQGVCDPFALISAPPNTSLALQSVDDSSVYWFDGTLLPNAAFKAGLVAPLFEDAATKLTEVSDAEPLAPTFYGMLIADRIYARTYYNLYSAPLDGGPLTPFGVQNGQNSAPLAGSPGHVFETTGSGIFFDFLASDGGVAGKETGINGAYDVTATPDGRFAFVIGRAAVDAGVDASNDASTWVSRAALYRYTVATQDLTLLTTFDASSSTASTLAADDQFVYFPEGALGSILRLPVDAPSGAVPTVLSRGNGRVIQQLALDEASVYFFASTDVPSHYFYDLLSVSKCGGGDFSYLGPTNHAFFPRGLAVDKTHVYWAASSAISRVAK